MGIISYFAIRSFHCILALWIQRSPSQCRAWQETCETFNRSSKMIQYDIDTRLNYHIEPMLSKPMVTSQQRAIINLYQTCHNVALSTDRIMAIDT